MAKKGQKFKKYYPELREEILRKYWSGESAHCLSVQYNIPQGTIEMWNYNLRHGKTGGRPGRQKSKNLTLEDYKERYEILKKYQAFLQARREKK